eukprot:m.195990 g.195990  ORF g.195990 m.195990 type:complete len:1114 (+) comp21825_c0_seq1:16-3357(+)
MRFTLVFAGEKLVIPWRDMPETATIRDLIALCNERSVSKHCDNNCLLFSLSLLFPRLAKSNKTKKRVVGLLTARGADMLEDDGVLDVLEKDEEIFGKATGEVFGAPREAAPPQPLPLPSAPPSAPAEELQQQQEQAGPADGKSVLTLLPDGKVRSLIVPVVPTMTYEALRHAIAKEAIAPQPFRARDWRVYLFDQRFPLHATRTTRAQTCAEWGLSTLPLLLCAVVLPKATGLDDADEGPGEIPSTMWTDSFFNTPSWQAPTEQTAHSMAEFLSSLYTVLSFLQSNNAASKNVLGHFAKTCSFPPAVLAFRYLLARQPLSFDLKAAFVTSFYGIARQLVPPAVKDDKLLSYSRCTWAFLLDNATADDAVFAAVVEREPVPDPVRVRLPDGTLAQECYERQLLLAKIADAQTVAVNGEERLVKEEDLVPDLMHTLQCKAFPFGDRNMLLFTAVRSPNPYSPVGQWSSIEGKIAKYNCLKISKSKSLKSSTPPLLTWTKDGNLGVFTSRLKNVGEDCEILDPVSQKLQSVDVDELAEHTAHLTSSATDIADERPAEEAIVVLLDLSSSMTAMWNPLLTSWPSENKYKVGDAVEIKQRDIWVAATVQEVLSHDTFEVLKTDQKTSTTIKRGFMRPSLSLSRLNMVKRLLDAFSGRSKAYDLPHEIGLTTFSSSVECRAALTRVFNHFEQHVENAVPNGCTKLYDALLTAGKELVNFKKKAPNCTLRILCLTDGDDIGSVKSELHAAAFLQQNGIICDSVLIGGTDNKPLKAISTVTRGFCFLPQTVEEALKIFEMETVLRVSQRSDSDLRKHAEVTSVDKLMEYANEHNYPFTVTPRGKRPAQASRPSSAPVKLLAQLTASRPKASFSVRQQRLLLRELSRYSKDPHPFITVYPCADDIRFWKMLLQGPDDTSYAGGTFLLYVEFGSDWPEKAPEVRFLTEIFHTNVNNCGRVCHSVLDRNWTSNLTLRNVLDCVYGLLLEPEPDDPLDSTVAELYYTDKAEFERKAKEHTQQHAAKTKEEWEMELLGHVQPDKEIAEPEEFLCGISLEVMTDPVSTKLGRSYERANIENWIDLHGTDPVSRHPLLKSDLVPNIALKKSIERWKQAQENPWWATDA